MYRNADGEVDGLLVYRADDNWGDAKQPLNRATVLGLIAETPAAERALWHFVCSIDWITTVRSGHRAPDDLLPLLLPDPRAARIVTQADWLWVRILDVVRALEARTYAAPATLILDIHDPAGLAGGRFRLDVGPGRRLVRTDDAERRSGPGRTGVGDALPRRRVGAAAGRAGPGRGAARRVRRRWRTGCSGRGGGPGARMCSEPAGRRPARRF